MLRLIYAFAANSHSPNQNRTFTHAHTLQMPAILFNAIHQLALTLTHCDRFAFIDICQSIQFFPRLHGPSIIINVPSKIYMLDTERTIFVLPTKLLLLAAWIWFLGKAEKHLNFCIHALSLQMNYSPSRRCFFLIYIFRPWLFVYGSTGKLRDDNGRLRGMKCIVLIKINFTPTHSDSR